MAKMNPLERLGTPQDIAAAVLSSLVPTAPGSMGSCFAPMAAWSEFGC